jgi:hypothetical protein
MNDLTKHRRRESILKPKGKDYSMEEGTRDCLKCRKPFNSVWFGNRVCDMCKETTLYGAGIEYDSY